MTQTVTRSENHLAPGCFGSALTFEADSSECKGCIFSNECRPISERNLAALRAQLGINAVGFAKKRKAKEYSGSTDLDTTLPKKVKALLDRLTADGIRITEAFSAGKNPFVNGPKFMMLTAHLMLNFPRPLSRNELAHALKRKFNWSEATAKAHALQAVQLLTHVGAVTTDANDIIRLKGS